MLKEEKVQTRRNMFRKEVEYVPDVRVGKTALTKQEIVSKYPESTQLNLLRKAILGDTEALSKLQEIEDYINAQFNS